MNILVYNPLARGNRGDKSLNEVIKKIDGDYHTYNVLEIEDYEAFINQFNAEDKVIVIGGDGTLSIFANNIRHIDVIPEVYFYAGGTGNDFMRNYALDFVPYEKQIDKVIAIGDIERIMINGFGVGVDCEVIERTEKLKRKNEFSYFIATIKSFFSYKPTTAKLTVDGKTFKYDKCWLIVAQNGTNFGGGMNVTPEAKNNDGLLDVCVVHSISRLKLLYHFPKVYKGKHVKLTKYFTIIQGRDIEIEMGKPRMHQVDGDLGKLPTHRFKVFIDDNK